MSDPQLIDNLGGNLRPVVQLSVDWNFIKEFPSIAAAIQGTGIPRHVINRILNGNFDEESEKFLWLDKETYDLCSREYDTSGPILQFRITPKLRKKGRM